MGIIQTSWRYGRKVGKATYVCSWERARRFEFFSYIFRILAYWARSLASHPPPPPSADRRPPTSLDGWLAGFLSPSMAGIHVVYYLNVSFSIRSRSEWWWVVGQQVAQNPKAVARSKKQKQKSTNEELWPLKGSKYKAKITYANKNNKLYLGCAVGPAGISP